MMKTMLKTMMSHLGKALILVAAVALAGQAWAETYTWTGGGTDNNWTTPANWGLSSGYPNDSTVGVIFAEDATVTVDASVSVLSVTIPDEKTVTIASANSGILQLYGDVNTVETVNQGTLKLSGATISAFAESKIYTTIDIADDTSNTLKTGAYGDITLRIYGDVTGSGDVVFNAEANNGNGNNTGKRSYIAFYCSFESFSGEAWVAQGGTYNSVQMKDDKCLNNSSSKWHLYESGREPRTQTSKGNYYIYAVGSNKTYSFGALYGTFKAVQFPSNTTGEYYSDCTFQIGKCNTNCGLSGSIASHTYTFDWQGDVTSTFTNAVTGIANFYVSGGGTLELANASCVPTTKICFTNDAGFVRFADGVTGSDISALLKNSDAAIGFDDMGVDYTWETEIASSNTGGFTKKGSGTLTLSTAPEYTGKTTVSEGVLVLPLGFTFPGEVEIAEGAEIQFAGDATWAAGSAQTICTFATGSTPDAATLERIKITGLGARQSWTYGATSGAYVATISGGAITWNGTATDWNAEGAWSIGSEATSYMTGDQVVFSDSIFTGETTEFTVNLPSDVDPATVTIAPGEGHTYVFTGEGKVASDVTIAVTGAGTVSLEADVFSGLDIETVGTVEVDVDAGEVTLGVVSSETSGTLSIVSGKATIANTGATNLAIENKGELAFSTNFELADATKGNLTGSGKMTVDGVTFTAYSTGMASVYTGDIYVSNSGKLRFTANKSAGSNPFGTGKIYLNGGTIDTSSGQSGAGYGLEIANDIDVTGEGNVVQNNMTIYNNSYVELSGDISGSGTLTMIDSTSSNGTKGIYLSGDNSAFEGTFNFTTEFSGSYTTFTSGHCNYSGFKKNTAGSASATWNVTEDSKYLGIFNASSTKKLELGAFNVPADMANGVCIGTAGTVVEVGGKAGATSTLESAFYNNTATLKKVGATSTLTLGSAFSMVSGSTIAINEGVFETAATSFDGVNFTFANGTKVNAELSDEDLTTAQSPTAGTTKIELFRTTGTVTLTGDQAVTITNDDYTAPTDGSGWILYTEQIDTDNDDEEDTYVVYALYKAAVAQVGEDKYASVSEAVEAAGANGTITILANVDEVVISVGQTVIVSDGVTVSSIYGLNTTEYTSYSNVTGDGSTQYAIENQSVGYMWNGTASAYLNWSEPSSWRYKIGSTSYTATRCPTTIDTVTLNNTYLVNLDTDATIKALTVDKASTITIKNDSDTEHTIETTTIDGTSTLFEGTATLTLSGNIKFKAGNFYSYGTKEIPSTVTIAVPDMSSRSSEKSSGIRTGTFDLYGTLTYGTENNENNASAFCVSDSNNGKNSTATLNIYDGASVTGYSKFAIGTVGTGSGTVVVGAGDASEDDDDPSFNIGTNTLTLASANASTGTLHVVRGTVTVGAMTVANVDNANTIGNVIMDGGALTASGPVDFGLNSGSASAPSLVMNGGIFTATRNTDVSSNSGRLFFRHNSAITLNGGTISAPHQGEFIGDGTITVGTGVKASGNIEFGNLNIGKSDSYTTTVTVNVPATLASGTYTLLSWTGSSSNLSTTEGSETFQLGTYPTTDGLTYTLTTDTSAKALVLTVKKAFTSGTAIPLGDSTTSPYGYVSVENGSVQTGYAVSGDTYYCFGGNSGANPTATITVYNETAGDYVLTWKGGLDNSNDVTYTVSVTDSDENITSGTYTQSRTGGWAPVTLKGLLLKNLPAGEVTITLTVTNRNGNSYAGNYGYFTFTGLADGALSIPMTSGTYVELPTNYVAATGCTIDSSGVGSTHSGHTVTFILYAATAGTYKLEYKSGAKSDWGTATNTWTLTSTAGVTTTLGTVGIGGDGYTYQGGAAKQNTHTVSLGTVSSGLYMLTMKISDATGDYAGNYGDFSIVSDVSITGVSVDYYASYTNADVTATVSAAGTYTLTVNGNNYAVTATEAGTITFSNVALGTPTVGDSIAWSIAASGTASGSESGSSTVGTTVDGSGWMKADADSTVGSWTDKDGNTETLTYTDGAASLSGKNTYHSAGVSTGEVVTVTTKVSFGDTADEDAVISADAQAAIKIASVNSVNTFQVLTNAAANAWNNVSNGSLGAPDPAETNTVVLTLNYMNQTYSVKVVKNETDYPLSDETSATSFPLASGASSLSKLEYLGAFDFVSLAGSYVSIGYSADVNEGETGTTATNIVVSADFVTNYLASVKATAVASTLIASRTEGNKLSYLASYALGLDPTDEEDKPLVDVQTDAEGKFIVTLKNKDGNTLNVANNVAVKLTMKSGTSPDALNTTTEATTGTGESASFTITPSDVETVKYYKIQVNIGAK